MKKAKKSLSLLLAATMALSACAVGFSSFAASTEEIKQIETEIMSATTISEELMGKVKGLTADEKDVLSVDAYMKVFNSVFTAQTGNHAEKQKASEDLLGGHSTQGKLAKEFAFLVSGNGPMTIKNGVSEGVDLVLPVTSVNGYNFKNDYKATDYVNDSKKLVITPAQQKLVALQLFENSNVISENPRTAMLANAFTCGVQSVTVNEVKKYVPYSYMGSTKGVNVLNTVFRVATNYVNFVLPDATVEEKQAKIFEFVKLPSADPLNLQEGFNNANKVVAALATFRTNGNATAFRAVIDPWLVQTDKDGTVDFYAAKISSSIIIYDGALAGISTLKSTVKKEIKNIEGAEAGKAFGAHLDSIEFPAEGSADFNAVISEAQAKYKALTTEAKNWIKASAPEIDVKYNKLLALAILVPGKSEHVPFEEPIKIDDGTAEMLGTVMFETLIPAIQEILKSFLSPAAMQGTFESLFTNENVTAVVKMIYPLMHGAVAGMEPVMGLEVPDLFDLTPAKLGLTMREPAYAKVKAELQKFGITEGEGEDEEVVDPGTVDDWEKITELDWGITPGNYEEFVTALLTGIKGVAGGLGGAFVVYPIVDKMLVGTYKTIPDGSAIDMTSFVPGAWDYLIIPLFEALGVDGKDMPTAAEYAMNMKTNGKTILNILKPLLDVVYYDLLPLIQKDPLDYVVSNLPNLIYHIEDGCLINGINRVLNDANVNIFGTIIDLKPMIMGLFGGADEITMEMIFGMIAPMLSDAGIDLTLDDIYKIGKMGTPTVVDTTRITVDSTIKVVADKESVMHYVVNALSGLLTGLGVDFAVKGEYVKVQVPAYPHDGKMGKDVINKLVSSLDETVLGFVNLADAINGGLATQEMAGTAIEAIYKGINGLLGNETIAGLGLDLEISPAMVADAMPEKKYSDLATYLKSKTITSWDLVDFTLKNDDGEVIQQINMGFKDGNMKDFIDCITASIRPLVEVLQSTISLTNKTVDGEVVYGLYETLIIPVFETIGLTPVATSETYTKNYNSKALSSEAEATDYLVATILKPVISLLEKFEAAPVATIMDILPAVAYALKYDPATAFIGNLLLGDKNFADVINPLLDGLLKGVLPENSTDVLTLNQINFDALISAGTVKTDKKSMSALHKTSTTVVADRADTFVTVFYYLFDTINTGDNLKTVKNLLGSIEMDATLKATLDSVVGTIFDMTREEALCFVGGMFADWTCPNQVDPEGGKGTNGKTPGTGDMAIASIAVVSVLFTAGAAIVLLRKRKTIAQ